MFSKIKYVLFKKKDAKDNDPYIAVSQIDINRNMKEKIRDLEELAEELCSALTKKYEREFEHHQMKNLMIWVVRDIDGDEFGELTHESCLEKEYRSQIAIDYDGEKFDDEFYAATVNLWYYFSGSNKGTGTLFDLKNNDLKIEVEKELRGLLTHHSTF
ncbi:hypothetical protein [Halobacillus massiliensis]|uniref:hypothetical protein n=1 Tax=Halobacillus massiliensis TaxID=1926286 RepID=UPI0009E54333|nr:hypothetical protein [Halobacillus massiliensis]